MKKLRKIWYRFNDLLDKSEPKGPKEWAVFIWMCMTLLLFIVQAFQIEDLYNTLLDILKQ